MARTFEYEGRDVSARSTMLTGCSISSISFSVISPMTKTAPGGRDFNSGLATSLSARARRAARPGCSRSARCSSSRRPSSPAPLAKLSPWLDWLITPREQVVARLEAQQHRRFIKTHTPLDGLPLDRRVTYIVVGRHPLDVAVSLYYQSGNINRDRVRELTSQYGPEDARKPRPALHEWLVSWIDSQDRPEEQLDSLSGVMWHLSDAWARRTSPVPRRRWAAVSWLRLPTRARPKPPRPARRPPGGDSGALRRPVI